MLELIRLLTFLVAVVGQELIELGEGSRSDPANDKRYTCSTGGTFATYDASTLTPEQNALAAQNWPGQQPSEYACVQGCRGGSCSPAGDGALKDSPTAAPTPANAVPQPQGEAPTAAPTIGVSFGLTGSELLKSNGTTPEEAKNISIKEKVRMVQLAHPNVDQAAAERRVNREENATAQWVHKACVGCVFTAR